MAGQDLGKWLDPSTRTSLPTAPPSMSRWGTFYSYSMDIIAEIILQSVRIALTYLTGKYVASTTMSNSFYTDCGNAATFVPAVHASPNPSIPGGC